MESPSALCERPKPRGRPQGVEHRVYADQRELRTLDSGHGLEPVQRVAVALEPLFPFDPVKFCSFITNTIPVYQGQVQYRLHLNGQGNVLFQWEGFLTRTADGALFHYVEQQFAVPRPDGTLEFIIEDIRLQPVGQ